MFLKQVAQKFPAPAADDSEAEPMQTSDVAPKVKRLHKKQQPDQDPPSTNLKSKPSTRAAASMATTDVHSTSHQTHRGNNDDDGDDDDNSNPSDQETGTRSGSDGEAEVEDDFASGQLAERDPVAFQRQLEQEVRVRT